MRRKRSSLGFWAVVMTFFVQGGFVVADDQLVRYKITDIGALLGSFESRAHGINSSGDVVGSWRESVWTWYGFVYNGTGIKILETLGGSHSLAFDINDSGDVVGYADRKDGSVAFLYRDGHMFDLGTLGSLPSMAFGINNFGQVVGHSSIYYGGYLHAFLYTDGIMTDIGTLAGGNSVAFQINDFGDVVGESELRAGSNEHLAYYLDEFTFRFNRRTSASRGKLFYRLAQQTVHVEHAHYAKLIGPKL